MEINILELRKKPMINFTVNYLWMQKMSNEDLEKWESELIEETKKSIEAEGREVKQEEIKFRVMKEASFIENDYKLLDQGF
jgi:hypothetical protein